MGFTGDTLGLGGRRSSFHQAGAGDGGGGGATTRAVGVACTWVINWKKAGEKVNTRGRNKGFGGGYFRVQSL